ncbi:MAG: hypothetical protein IH629_07510 [Thermoleophilia bacterium]|nr:hypothetical protein [Thermoleophilia bacterium]
MAGERHGSRTHSTTRRALTALALVALAALLLGGLAACGSSSGSVAGDYKYDSGSEQGMEGFTLKLNDDDTFTLTAPNPEGGEDIGINGTYTVDGDNISLKNEDGSESEPGTVDGDKLVFETVTWVKQ